MRRLGAMPVMSRQCMCQDVVMSRSCLGHFFAVSGHVAGHVSDMSWSYDDSSVLVPVMSQSCHTSVPFRLCTYSTRSCVGHFCICCLRLVMSQIVFPTCPGHVVVISKSSSCNESVYKGFWWLNGCWGKSLPV